MNTSVWISYIVIVDTDLVRWMVTAVRQCIALTRVATSWYYQGRKVWAFVVAVTR
jgi:hypothetical protein